jgi:hypothetical protein
MRNETVISYVEFEVLSAVVAHFTYILRYNVM